MRKYQFSLRTNNLTARELLPKRDPAGYKNTFGRVVFISGSYEMAGCAVLGAKAAYRTGAGMVKVVTPECNRQVIHVAVPEALVSVWDRDQDQDEVSLRHLRPSMYLEFNWADVIAIGPGIGLGDAAEVLLRSALSYEYQQVPERKGLPRKNVEKRQPLVVDADALNLLAQYPELLHRLPFNTILTPHTGELYRLFKSTVAYIKKHGAVNLHELEYAYVHKDNCELFLDLLEEAVQAQGNLSAEEKERLVMATFLGMTLGVTVVAKGARTFVVNGRSLMDKRMQSEDVEGVIDLDIFVNDHGNDGMGTAGSGDVLTGVIAALLAQGMTPEQAAENGVVLHALAGDYVAKERGNHALMAGDLVEAIGR